MIFYLFIYLIICTILLSHDAWHSTTGTRLIGLLYCIGLLETASCTGNWEDMVCQISLVTRMRTSSYNKVSSLLWVAARSCCCLESIHISNKNGRAVHQRLFTCVKYKTTSEGLPCSAANWPSKCDKRQRVHSFCAKKSIHHSKLDGAGRPAKREWFFNYRCVHL